MIVNKLFNIITPTHVVFGQKDAQQLIIITKMIENKNFPIKMLSGKTIRDKNGLALSSRNSYLSTKDQDLASNIYKGLMQIKQMLQGEITDVNKLKDSFSRFINSFSDFKIDYISIASLNTLEEVEEISGSVLISTAVFLKNIRLIDNFIYSST